MPYFSVNRIGFNYYRPLYAKDISSGGSGFRKIRQSEPVQSIQRSNLTKLSSVPFKGISSNCGIAIGKALVVTSKLDFDSIKAEDLSVEAKTKGVSVDEIVNERMIKTESAFSQWKSLQYKKGSDVVRETQIMIIESLFPSILEKMQSEKLSYIDASREVLNEYFNIDNPGTKRTVEEIKKILAEIYSIKLGKHIEVESLIKNCNYNNIILVTHDLTPTDDFYTNPKVVGIIREKGGTTDHASLMASAHNIISVVHATDITKHVRTGDNILIDTSQKHPIILNPSRKLMNEAIQKKKILDAAIESAKQVRNKKVVNPVTDEVISFMQNIASVSEAENVKVNMLDGVGLARSEYFFMINELGDRRGSEPTIDEQIKFYNSLQHHLGDNELLFRTIDVAAKIIGSDFIQKDKDLPYFDISVKSGEEADGLGLCLNTSTPLYYLFRNQLEAILRSDLRKVMFPQVRSKAELDKAFEIIDSITKELEQKGEKVNKNKTFGIMIENPSIIEELPSILESGRVLFLSIGTNDLTMAITGISRYSNSEQTYYEQQFSPAVREALRKTKRIADSYGIPVSVCGDIVNDWRGFIMLLCLGYNRFSFSNPINAYIAKKIASAVDSDSLQELLKILDQVTTPSQAMKSIEEFTYEKIKTGKWALQELQPYLEMAIPQKNI